MHPFIRVKREKKRGCGWRKVGGKYLIGQTSAVGCGRIPIPLTTCPCCSHGFKPARGWTWVDGDRIVSAVLEGSRCIAPLSQCSLCVINRILIADLENRDVMGMAGLIWVGQKFYPTVEDFNRESLEQGICRRLNSIPRDFVLGETYVLLAHQKAIANTPYIEGKLGETEYTSGIFKVWRPTTIEVVVDGTEPDEVIEGYLEKGLTPVIVERIEDDESQQALDL